MKLLTRILPLAVVLLVVLLVPSAAVAAVDDAYQGLGTVQPQQEAATSATAWRWFSDFGWDRTTRVTDQRVWIQKFDTGWMWTWTPVRGWLAMHDYDLAADASVATDATDVTEAGTVYLTWDTDNVAQSYVTLTFHCSDGSTYCATDRTVTSSSTGGYTIALHPGTYTVTMDVSGTDTQSVTVDADGATDAPITFANS